MSPWYVLSSLRAPSRCRHHHHNYYHCWLRSWMWKQTSWPSSSSSSSSSFIYSSNIPIPSAPPQFIHSLHLTCTLKQTPIALTHGEPTMSVKYEFYVFIPRLFPWLFFVYINPLNATPYKTPYDESNNQSINRKALKKERERERSSRYTWMPWSVWNQWKGVVFAASASSVVVAGGVYNFLLFFGAVDETWALVILLLLTTIDKEQ